MYAYAFVPHRLERVPVSTELFAIGFAHLHHPGCAQRAAAYVLITTRNNRR